MRCRARHLVEGLPPTVRRLREAAEGVVIRLLELQAAPWLLGVLVLAVGILAPLGVAASRNKLLQQAWEKATGKAL